MNDEGKSSLGFEEGEVAAASYFYLLGLLILILERRSNFVRFHALQSSLGFGILTILLLCVKWIEPLHAVLWWAPGLLMLSFAVYMMYHAYHGEEYKFPIIGKLAYSAIYETDTESEEQPILERDKIAEEQLRHNLTKDN
jgi:uncharacterized membrane protein